MSRVLYVATGAMIFAQSNRLMLQIAILDLNATDANKRIGT